MPKNIEDGLRAVNNDDCRALENRLDTCPGIAEALGGSSRNRLFTVHRTFCLFLWQVMAADRSCSEVVQCTPLREEDFQPKGATNQRLFSSLICPSSVHAK